MTEPSNTLIIHFSKGKHQDKAKICYFSRCTFLLMTSKDNSERSQLSYLTSPAAGAILKKCQEFVSISSSVAL